MKKLLIMIILIGCGFNVKPTLLIAKEFSVRNDLYLLVEEPSAVDVLPVFDKGILATNNLILKNQIILEENIKLLSVDKGQLLPTKQEYFDFRELRDKTKYEPLRRSKMINIFGKFFVKKQYYRKMLLR